MIFLVEELVAANKIDMAIRIDTHTPKEPMSGCWLWIGSVNPSGYGKMTLRVNTIRKYSTAHRESYKLFVGPIPEDKMVLHSCDVASCCNPNHLYLGTNSDNQKDRYQRSKRFKRNETNGRFCGV